MPIKLPTVQTGFEQSIDKAAKKAGKNLKINMGPGAKSVEGLTRPLGRLTGKADEFTKSMEAANARVLAFGASVGVIAAVSNALKELVTTTIQVEKSLANINSILKQSDSQLDGFKNQIFDIARNTGQTFDVVAEAALELSRQGLKAEEVTKRLNDALVLSRLSGLSASDAVAGLTAAVNSFSSAGLTTTDVLNKISAAAASAAVSDRDLIEGLKRSGAVAVASGVQFDELIGIISALQEKTARGGSVIGNSLKTIFTRIQDIEKLQTLQDLGVQVTDLEGKVLSSSKVIENLAPVFAKMSQASKVNLADNLVGKFQIAPFLALLEDFNQKISRSGEVATTSFNATNEAYERNTVLNNTLATAINTATVNLKELANALGEIGVTENLSKIIGVFNDVVSKISGVLDGDGIGSKFAKGLIKGISAIISGPGLALALVAIGKLLLDFGKFGVGALKTFFGLNKAAEAQKILQGQIAASLLNDKSVRSAILSIEKQNISEGEKKKLQTAFFTKALNEQLMVMQKMQGIARTIAPGVMAGTSSRRGGRAAGGFLPVGAERSDISKGVGGAPASAKPVVIPNFAFGGGKRGTMVANSSEYIVPNYANGGDAIFNQNMASSMGLPSNARKVRAASGYIPNFAVGPAGALSAAGITSMTQFRALSGTGKTRVIDGVKVTEAQAKNVFSRNKKGIGKRSFMANQEPNKSIMLVPRRERFLMNGSDHHFMKAPYQSKAGNGLIDFFEGPSAGISKRLKKDSVEGGRFKTLLTLDGDIEKALARGVNGIFTKFRKKAGGANAFKTKPNKITSSNLKNIMEKGGAGALGAVKGATFEALMQAIVGGVSQVGKGQLDVDFSKDEGNILDVIFGIQGKNFKFGDFKSSRSGGNKTKFAKQILDNVKGKVVVGRKAKMTNSKTAASGYIPNFAEGALEEAVGREKAAGLPVSQIRINQSGKLRNAQNPMGLAVTNTRDEPTGAIPAARGFIPNFNRTSSLPSDMVSRGSSSENQSKSTNQVTKANRDYLGTIFAVQAGLTALSAATNESKSGLGKFTSILSGSLSSITGFAFAASAISTIGKNMQEGSKGFKAGLGGFVSKLAVGGALIAGAFEVFKFGKELYNEYSGANERAAKALIKLEDASEDLSFAFKNLSKEEQFNVKKQAERIIGRRGPQEKLLDVLNFEGKNEFGETNVQFAMRRNRERRETQRIRGKTQKDIFDISPEGEVRTLVDREFGIDGKGGDLEPQFNEVAAKLVALGVSIEKIDDIVDDFGSELSAEDFGKFVDISVKLAKEAREAQKKFQKFARSLSAEELSNLKQRFESGEVQFSDNMSPKMISDILSKTSVDKDEARSQAIDQLTLTASKARIATALELKKLDIDSNKQAQKRLEKAQQLGVVDKVALQDLKAKAELEKMSNDFAKERIDFLAKEGEKLTNLGVKPEDVDNFKEALKGLSTKDITEEGAEGYRKILREILIIGGANEGQANQAIKALEDQLKGQDELNEAKRKGLENDLKSEKTIAKILEATRKITTAAALSKLRIDVKGGQQQFTSDQAKRALQRSTPGTSNPFQRGVSRQTAQIDLDAAMAQAARNTAKLQEDMKVKSAKLGELSIVANAALTDIANDGTKSADEKRKLASDATKDVNELAAEMALMPETVRTTNAQLVANALAAKDSADALGTVTGAAAVLVNIVDGLEQQRQNAMGQTTFDANQLELMGLPEAEARKRAEREAIKNNPDLTPANALEKARLERDFQGRMNLRTKDDAVINSDFLDSMVDASVQFRDNFAAAFAEGIKSVDDLEDALLNAANQFLQSMTKNFANKFMDQAASEGGGKGLFGLGIGIFANGGPVRGGSGNRDDVPAMLMGGEFVMNKKAVQRYGSGFMEAINSGSVRGFARGGQVRDEEGMFTTPGMNGAGAIVGMRDLMSFATQSPVAMNRDTITNNGAFLDPESGRLTMFGRRNNPQFKKVQDAKRQAFDLALQEAEAHRQAKEQEVKLGDMLAAAVISSVVSFGATKLGMAAGLGEGMSGLIGSGLGNFAGTKITGAPASGGAFGAAGATGDLMDIFSGDKGGNSKSYFDVGGAGSGTGLPSAANPSSKQGFFSGLFSKTGDFFKGLGSGGGQQGSIIGPFDRAGNYIEAYADMTQAQIEKARGYATGGLIPAAGGVDTVPAMLSGGEFVMNAAATRNIGAGNLQALNSGAGTGDNTDLVSKLDELIAATETSQSTGDINITINSSDGTESQTGGEDAQESEKRLSEKIKFAVKRVIADEQRLGGQLRK